MTRFEIVLSLPLVLVLMSQAPGSLIANGDFESVSGGVFDSWTYAAGRGLVESQSAISGNYSAEIVAGYNDNFLQVPTAAVSDFIFQMDFAVFPFSAGRTMNTLLYWGPGAGNGIAINMRVANDNRLQVVSGNMWIDIGTLTVIPTTDTGTSNLWDGETPVVNHLQIVGHLSQFASSNYDVTLNGQTVTGITHFQNPWTGIATINAIQLQGGGGSTQNWLADNLVFVPEPSAAVIAGLLVFAVFLGRRREGIGVSCTRKVA